MKYVTLREIIDDILLLVRNNNISESEDLSRAQIGAWVKHYRHHIWKLRKDELENKFDSLFPTVEDLVDLFDDEFFSVKETFHTLIRLDSKKNNNSNNSQDNDSSDEENKYEETTNNTINYHTDKHGGVAMTSDTLKGLFKNSWKSVLAVHDEDGENIQYMNHIRRHYHNFRKYTFGEMTAFYDQNEGRIFIQGLQDQGKLSGIWVLALYENDEDDGEGDEDDDDIDEDNIKIPAWMVPPIKERIMKNELAFMLNRPSDDDNNATLQGIKPHGPQDQEK